MEREGEVEEIERRGSIQSMALFNLVLGAWLIVSPWFLNYSSSAIWNQVILGAAVIVLSLVRLFAPSQQWSSFLNGLCGIWLIIAPFIIGFQQSAAAYWNGIIAGIIVAWIGFTNSTVYMSHHHGTA